jgi:hypothetical protein
MGNCVLLHIQFYVSVLFRLTTRGNTNMESQGTLYQKTPSLKSGQEISSLLSQSGTGPYFERDESSSQPHTYLI